MTDETKNILWRRELFSETKKRKHICPYCSLESIQLLFGSKIESKVHQFRGQILHLHHCNKGFCPLKLTFTMLPKCYLGVWSGSK